MFFNERGYFVELMDLIYDGVLLPKYCVDNNIPYNDIVKIYRRQRKNKKLDKKTDIELVENIINNIIYHRQNRVPESKYYVYGMSLSDYARMKNIHPTALRSAIKRGLLKDPNASLEKLADEFIDRLNNKTTYFYDGYPLLIFCKEHGLSSYDIMREYYTHYKNIDGLSKQEAINEIVNQQLSRRK